MRNFNSNQNGNVAILFALSVIPVIGAMGAAVDYSMANAQRAGMQAAADATVLALAKMMPLSQQDLDTRGANFFAANLGATSISNLQLTIVPSTGKINLTAAGTYQPKIVNVLGAGSFPLGVQAESRWSIGKVEVALALDNSLSMNSSGKMTALKTAALNFLDFLENSVTTPGDAKIAIVPFDTAVNVGTANINATWIKWSEWNADNQTCTGWGWSQTCTPKNHSYWDGCVWDRDKNNDTTDTAPTSSSSTKYPAYQCDDGLVAMLPLTYDWTALRNKINAMAPVGWTNVTIGVEWAWHLLSSTAVYTEGAAYNTPNLSKFLIILTDGLNTKNRHHDSSSVMDQRTALACANAKAAGIKIFAIRVIEGNATLLQNCASELTMYFDVQDAGQLSGVFSAIGANIASLRLSK